jgi:hypothetical protein
MYTETPATAESLLSVTIPLTLCWAEAALQNKIEDRIKYLIFIG